MFAMNVRNNYVAGAVQVEKLTDNLRFNAHSGRRRATLSKCAQASSASLSGMECRVA